MKIALIVVMILAAIVMVWGLAKQKAGVEWGKPVATLGAIVALICALAQMFSGGGSSPKKIMESQLEFTKISTVKMGSYLADKYPGAKAVVLTAPAPSVEANGKDQATEAMLEGLKQGLKGKIDIVEVVSIQPDMPKGMTPGDPKAMEFLAIPLEAWFTAEKFDGVVQGHVVGKADMVISLAGLPAEVAKMKFWNLNPRPKLALGSGNIFELQKAIEAGAVSVAITANPKADYEKLSPPSDVEKAFALRFLLVTPENVKQVAADNPGMFITK